MLKYLYILFLICMSTHSFAAKRVALLISNEAYMQQNKLKNPVNDGRLLSKRLTSLGYDVTFVTDANRASMIEAIESFKRKSSGADSAIFYYSGHGMQDDARRNYLLPVNARINSDTSIRSYGVEAYEVIDALKQARPRISLVILDACRNNPYSGVRGSRDFTVTNYKIDTEMLVSYATQSGEYAQDGDVNSPFAKALNRHLRDANKTPLLEIFDNVSDSVKKQTENKQRPTRSGDVRVKTYLINLNQYLDTSSNTYNAGIQTSESDTNNQVSKREGNYIFYNNGTALNNITKEMWSQCNIGQQFENGICVGSSNSLTYYQALSEVRKRNNLKFLGYDDWKIPEIFSFAKEFNCFDKSGSMVSIPDESGRKHQAAKNCGIVSNQDYSIRNYWSSSKYDSTNAYMKNWMWSFSVTNGKAIIGFQDKADRAFVRLVRKMK